MVFLQGSGFISWFAGCSPVSFNVGGLFPRSNDDNRCTDFLLTCCRVLLFVNTIWHAIMLSMAIPICRDEGLSGFIGFAAPDAPRELEAEKIPSMFVPAVTFSLRALVIV